MASALRYPSAPSAPPGAPLLGRPGPGAAWPGTKRPETVLAALAALLMGLAGLAALSLGSDGGGFDRGTRLPALGAVDLERSLPGAR